LETLPETRAPPWPSEWDDVVSGHCGGAVSVIQGSSSGLIAAGNQLWSQDSPGIAGKSEDEDAFRVSLTAGKFAGTPYTDLAVGVPGENDFSGAVHVIYGSADGLRAEHSQVWSQATKGIPGKPEYPDGSGG
jgi:hypothetical protein